MPRRWAGPRSGTLRCSGRDRESTFAAEIGNLRPKFSKFLFRDLTLTKDPLHTRGGGWNMTMLSEETAVLSIREREPAGAPAAEMAKLRTSVGKAVAVLSAFQCTGGAMLGVSQVAERANLSKSTAHRILAVLVENGYVERRGARYQLGRAIFELGHLVPSCRPRKRIPAMPFLIELWEYTHATVHLAILDGNDVLYLQKVHGPNSDS